MIQLIMKGVSTMRDVFEVQIKRYGGHIVTVWIGADFIDDLAELIKLINKNEFEWILIKKGEIK